MRSWCGERGNRTPSASQRTHRLSGEAGHSAGSLSTQAGASARSRYDGPSQEHPNDRMALNAESAENGKAGLSPALLLTRYRVATTDNRRHHGIATRNRKARLWRTYLLNRPGRGA